MLKSELRNFNPVSYVSKNSQSMRSDKKAHHLYVHLTWCTAERVEMLTPRIQPFVEEIISEVCKSFGYRIIALNILTEHVHLLLEFKSTHQLADLMKAIKGRSARLVNQRFGEKLKWQASYGADTVGLKALDIARRYVLNQKVNPSPD